MLEWTGPMFEHTRAADGLLLLEKDNMPHPPANITLCHLGIPSRHEGPQDDCNELDF